MPTVSTHLVDFVHRDPRQPRQDFPEHELRSLGASVAKKQLVPVITHKSGMLVDRERSWPTAFRSRSACCWAMP